MYRTLLTFTMLAFIINLKAMNLREEIESYSLYTEFKQFCKFKKSKSYNNLSSHHRMLQERISRMQTLCSTGADINQQWNFSHPINTIIDNKGISEAEKKAFISLLVQNGCNLQLRKDIWDKQSVIEYYRKSTDDDKHKWYELLHHYRYIYHYAKARQFLIAYYKEPESPIATLPLDIVRIIGTMIMQDYEKALP